MAQTAWTLTNPPRRTYSFALARGLPGDPGELPPALGGARPFETWTHRAQGVTLAVWELPGEAPRGPTVIFSHGWGESRIHALLRVEALIPHASRLVLYDLRGHGESTGRCTLGLLEAHDLRSLIDAVVGPAPPTGDAGPGVVLAGSSLGGGVSIAAAADDPRVIAVIAEGPYRAPQTPARAVMARSGLPWRLNLPPALGVLGLLRGQGLAWFSSRPCPPFDRALLAGRVRAPLLVLHGELDSVCPLSDGRAIADAAPHGRLAVIPGGGHSDLWTDARLRELAVYEVERFVRAVAPAISTR